MYGGVSISKRECNAMALDELSRDRLLGLSAASQSQSQSPVRLLQASGLLLVALHRLRARRCSIKTQPEGFFPCNTANTEPRRDAVGADQRIIIGFHYNLPRDSPLWLLFYTHLSMRVAPS